MSKQTEEEINRKRFLLRLSLGLGGVGAAIVSVPVISALLSPILQKDGSVWRSVGMLHNFPVGSTKQVEFINANPKPYAGVTGKSGAWIRRTDQNNLIAFAANCSHLGCPVRWEETAGLFMCPCHGGVYYKDGTVAAGPPPKPLSQYPVRIFKGQVQIETGPLPLTHMSTSK